MLTVEFTGYYRDPVKGIQFFEFNTVCSLVAESGASQDTLRLEVGKDPSTGEEYHTVAFVIGDDPYHTSDDMTNAFDTNALYKAALRWRPSIDRLTKRLWQDEYIETIHGNEMEKQEGQNAK